MPLTLMASAGKLRELHLQLQLGDHMPTPETDAAPFPRRVSAIITYLHPFRMIESGALSLKLRRSFRGYGRDA
jgi:hypothetical protein